MKHAILIIAYHQADFIKQCIDNFDDDFLVSCWQSIPV